jgi:hypothetical protein
LLDFDTVTPQGLWVDDTYLYWTNLQVLRAEKTAPAKTGTTAGDPFADEGGSPTHLVGDGTMLYYLDPAMGIGGVPTSGTPMPQAPPVVSFGTWSSKSAPIAVDATSVYFWSEGSTSLVKVDKTSQKSTTLSGAAFGAVDDNCGIVVDGTTVYYSTASQPGQAGIVARVSAAGGEQPTIVVDDTQGAVGVFAVDESNVYFMTPAGVMKVAKGGGQPVSLATLQPPSAFPTCMAVDDKYVYWVDGLKLMQYAK